MLGLRNRLLSDPGVQARLSRFALTRPIARRRSRALFDLCAGFVYSQVLVACVRLHLLERLREGPRTTDALAGLLELDVEATERLMRAAAALRLVRKVRGGWALDGAGAALLGNPGALAMIDHHDLLYRDLDDPVALLRGRGTRDTAIARFWHYGTAPRPQALADDEVRKYSALMAASNAMVAQEVFTSYGLARHERLLDVGGGDGSFLAAVAEQAPHLQLALFDLPAVAEQARERLIRSLPHHRVEVHGGDFFFDPLPGKADLVTLVRIIHDHDDDRALALLRNIRRSVAQGTVLLVAEPMAVGGDDDRISDAYFGFYLLAMGSGRCRTPRELAALLSEAGFRSVRRCRGSGMPFAHVMTAKAESESSVSQA